MTQNRLTQTRLTQARFTIRAATLADLPAITGIYNDAVLHTTASYDEEPKSLTDRQAWFTERRQQGLPVVVAEGEQGGERGERGVLGWGSYGPFRPKSGYRFTVEHSVYVAEDQRGQGVGKALLAHLIEDARRGGVHAMIASVDAQNPVSQQLHASFGFREVARLPEVGFKFGRWLDVVYLQLILPADPARAGGSSGHDGHR